MVFRRLTILTVCMVAFCNCATVGVAAQQYRIRDLGEKYTQNWATGLNDSGQVVGGYGGYNPPPGRGFVWDATHGARGLGGTANGINGIGQIVGSYFHDPSSYGRSHACLWNSASSTREDLGTLGGGGDSSSAAAINDLGQIAGYSYSTGTTSHAFLWDRATGMHDLGTLNGGVSYAYDINNNGQVVGEVTAPSGTGYNTAFIWDNTNHMQDLGNLGGTHRWSLAHAINDSGQVVGYSSTSAYYGHAFIWNRAGGIRDIGTLGQESNAWDINNSGVVVGSSAMSDGPVCAFVWNETDGMVALASLGGGNGSRALSINDQGWIAGYSYTTDGYQHAVLWEPVPEPSSVLALFCGISGLSAVVWRRKQ